jgi:hypothetical protein
MHDVSLTGVDISPNKAGDPPQAAQHAHIPSTSENENMEGDEKHNDDHMGGEYSDNSHVSSSHLNKHITQPATGTSQQSNSPQASEEARAGNLFESSYIPSHAKIAVAIASFTSNSTGRIGWAAELLSNCGFHGYISGFWPQDQMAKAPVGAKHGSELAIAAADAWRLSIPGQLGRVVLHFLLDGNSPDAQGSNLEVPRQNCRDDQFTLLEHGPKSLEMDIMDNARQKAMAAAKFGSCHLELLPEQYSEILRPPPPHTAASAVPFSNASNSTEQSENSPHRASLSPAAHVFVPPPPTSLKPVSAAASAPTKGVYIPGKNKIVATTVPDTLLPMTFALARSRLFHIAELVHGQNWDEASVALADFQRALAEALTTDDRGGARAEAAALNKMR